MYPLIIWVSHDQLYRPMLAFIYQHLVTRNELVQIILAHSDSNGKYLKAGGYKTQFIDEWMAPQ